MTKNKSIILILLAFILPVVATVYFELSSQVVYAFLFGMALPLLVLTTNYTPNLSNRKEAMQIVLSLLRKNKSELIINSQKINVSIRKNMFNKSFNIKLINDGNIEKFKVKKNDIEYNEINKLY